MKRLLKSCNKSIFVYDTMGEYNDCGIVFTNADALEKFWVEHTDFFKIVYQPLQPRQEFNYIASLVYSVGDCVFVVEELDNFCSPYEFSLEFANIIQRGRHANIDFLGVSQRPYGINRTISAQCKEIITFQQSEPRDIAYLSTYIGKEVEIVRELGQYEYLRWDSGTITIHKPGGEITGHDKEEQEEPKIEPEPEEEKTLDNLDDF